MKVWASTLLLGLRFFTSIVEAELDKPGLLESGDLDKFEPGLKASLPKVSIKETVTWSPGWIFPDCKNFADIYNFSVADIETIEVYYDDCDSPWILCHHKDSPDPAWHFFEYFGRLPVRARSHIKGMISLPQRIIDSFVYRGQYHDGYIAIFGNGYASSPHHEWHVLYIMIHELGHALDYTGAYADKMLSSSKNWQNAYNGDSKILDDFAKYNFQEDLAQETIVAAYDLNVPGGLGAFPERRDWSSIQNQYELVKKEQADAGNLLIPGGTCTQRLENGQPVQIPTKKTRKTKRRHDVSSNTGLEDEVDTDEPVYSTSEFYDLTKADSKVKRTTMLKGKPNVELAKGLKVIHLPKNMSTEYTCPGY